MASKTRTYSTTTRHVAQLLGRRIALARRERGWTVAELAARVGVTPPTIRKVEHGDLGVAVGTVLEAAVVVGVPLVDESPSRLRDEVRRVDERLALLPQRVRRPTEVDDNF